MDNTSVIRTWLKLALGVKLLQTAVQLIIWLITGCRDIYWFVVPPVLSAVVYTVIFLMLRSRTKKAPNPADGDKPLILGAVIPFVFSLAVVAVEYILRWHVWNKVYGLEEIRILDSIKHYQNLTEVLNGASVILFAAAAGMIGWRSHTAEKQ